MYYQVSDFDTALSGLFWTFIFLIFRSLLPCPSRSQKLDFCISVGCQSPDMENENSWWRLLLFQSIYFERKNGKVSALRWVLGEEWDMLDTGLPFLTVTFAYGS